MAANENPDDREAARFWRKYERLLEELGTLLAEAPDSVRTDAADRLYEWAANQRD